MSLLDRIVRLENIVKDPSDFVVIPFPWESSPDVYAKRWLAANRSKAKDRKTVLIMKADYSETKPRWTPIPKEEPVDGTKNITVESTVH